MEEQIQQQNIDKEIDLVKIIAMLWRSRKFIVIVTGMSVIIGIIYILFSTPMYRSRITLYPAQQGGSSPMNAMAKQLGMINSQAGDTNYNIPDVVKSRTLSEQIVAHEWDIEGFGKKITLLKYFMNVFGDVKPENIITKNDEERLDQRRLYFYSEIMASNRIFVVSNAKTGLITVSVEMENAKLSRDIANFISLFVANWVNDTQKESNRKNLEFIEERALKLGVELQEAENGLKGFRETNRNILNSPDLQLELQRLQRRVSIKQEVYLTLIKQKELAQIEENKSADIVQILDRAIEPRFPAKPNRLKILISSIMIGLLIGLSMLVFTKFYKVLIMELDKEE